MWGHVVTGGLLAVPVAIIAARQLAFLRARRRHPRASRTAWADVGMIVGTAPWLWMILTPSIGANGINVVPFRDLAMVVRSSPQTMIVQVGGNLLVFAALGALLPVRSPRFAGLAAVAAVAATASICVETLQYVLRLGRVSSIDDVLLNTTGALLAAMVTRRWWDRARVVW
jgi:glycopeptide antibiotics resistance protein